MSAWQCEAGASLVHGRRKRNRATTRLTRPSRRCRSRPLWQRRRPDPSPSRRHRLRPPRGRTIRLHPTTSSDRRSWSRCRRRYPRRWSSSATGSGDWTVIVGATSLLDVARFLRESDEGSFDYCADVTASDWPPREKRFDVIYCLYSTRRRHRVRIKVRVGRERTGAVGDQLVAGRQLARARALGHVRCDDHRASRSAPDSDARELAGASAAEGLPARRTWRAPCSRTRSSGYG